MFVLATTGHVDHGKSVLVRALTGMEPDRWAEERRRAMTIDLGYAWTTLPSGAQLAFVDVPGHQRFIANMLAGLGPAPAVLFVVAADEGWRRQSTEHLAAISALEIRHGLLAVTRSDLADPQPALADAQRQIGQSTLGDVDAVAVSGTTGDGLPKLRNALDRLVARLPEPDVNARVRMWIDRCFTIRGAGTVVTGTLTAGRLRIGDHLEIRGRPVTVRALQTTGTSQREVTAVARVAVNLRGIARDELGRGDALLTPRAWHTTDVIDIRVDIDAKLPTQLVMHVGTAAVPVHVRPFDERTARLTLPAAMPLQAGDRAVLRDPGRQRLVAGVLMLDADPPPLMRRGAAAARAAQLAAWTGRPNLKQEVARRGAARYSELARLGVPISEAPGVVRCGDWAVDESVWQEWVRTAPNVVGEWAIRDPLDPGVPLAALPRLVQMPDDAQLVASVVAAAGLAVHSGRARRPGEASGFGTAETAVATLVERLRHTPFDAPQRKELAALRLGRRELAAAERTGVLLRISPDVVLLPDAPARAVDALRTLSQPFTTSDARLALGTTRRVVIPLLEYLDAAGLTERIDAIQRRLVTDQPSPRSLGAN